MVHASPYAGQWYPADAAELQDLLAAAFTESGRRTGSGLFPAGLGFVVPHAAPMYSGNVAASVYRHIAHERPRRIVLLGFSHRGGPDAVGVPLVDAYRTPLGEVPVDRRAREALVASDPVFRSVPEERLCDHSVEIQLPLLQSSGEFEILPLYVGTLEAAERARAAAVLAGFADGSTVFLASSDFTHYGRSFGFQPFPLNSSTPDRLAQLDSDAIDAASSLDADFFLAELRRSGATVCGYNPIGLLLETMRRLQAGRPASEEIFQQQLDYQTSGEITKDFSHSVSYGALGFFPAPSFYLSEDDQARILSAARATLDRYVQTGVREAVAPEVTPGLARPTAAFVTIYRKNELQGCIGRVHDPLPAGSAIPRLTLSAALEDSRFEPVHRGDDSLSIEISVLTPMKRIASTGAFILHEHGAFLESGPFRGLLLPKVAEEHGMNREQFLSSLARKAGARPDIYNKPETRLRVFRAQVFGGKAV